MVERSIGATLLCEVYYPSCSAAAIMFDGMAASLFGTLREIVPQTDMVTHCFWREPSAAKWMRGIDVFPETEGRFRDGPAGAGLMLEQLVCDPDLTLTTTVVNRGYAHFEVEDVRQLFDHAPLSDELIPRLNSHADPNAIRERGQSMRYGQTVRL